MPAAPPELFVGINAIGDEPALAGINPEGVDRWQSILRRRRDDHGTIAECDWVGRDNESASRSFAHRRDDTLDVIYIVNGCTNRLDTQRSRGRRDGPEIIVEWRPVGIGDDRNPHHGGGDVLKRLQPLARHIRLEIAEPGNVAAWLCETGDKALSRIGYPGKDDRYGTRLIA